MTVGILTIWLEIPGSGSLKDKRRVLKSLLEMLKNRFNISAAEIGENDIWRRAVIGMACVSNVQSRVNVILNGVIRYVESDPRVAVLETQMEML